MQQQSAKPAVYLDHAATTPVAAEVIEAMTACMQDPLQFANPSSLHIAGRAAATVEESSRLQVAKLIAADAGSLLWTSGATEANNLAILGAARFRAHRGRHVITLRTEHKAVLDPFSALQKQGFEVTWLTPDADGLLAIDELRATLRADTQLVSVMHVNNETGVVQDVAAIGALCREHDVLYHCDAAQSAGKLPIDVDEMHIDLLSMTAHKMHGPAGIGALYVANRHGCGVEPILYGGGQQRRLRPGTLPIPLIAGFSAASKLMLQEREQHLTHMHHLHEALWHGVRDLPGICRNGSATQHFPGILNVSAAGVEGESLLLALEPLCVASGSACNSQSGEPSYVLRALGRSDLLAQSAIRFSFGRGTTLADIEIARDSYISAIRRLREIAPAAARAVA
ncbi:MAG: aminotransferase class V-fold PLP-dependent enzyme [Woeseia sp.]